MTDDLDGPTPLFPLEEYSDGSDPASAHEIAAKLWMAENPEVMALFEKLALEATKAGRRFGLKLLAERVRWEYSVRRRQDYTINNNHTAYIARELVRRKPRIAKYLEFRAAGKERA